ncbi:hypothetical protein GYMLUDRAFT_768459 [Collybiopsis luxurians FD-317 M1]|uniref:Uncharacterized protein n=1 Tax=Collybiopsis luxurians FD-317 M1 TaxID=944289 RepID=A0A0D0C4D1_9AGAR|nr:hypothetical protein GYMLUDRAFT_768459 [Collybiopsis luxurians FD-317 M1]
MDRRLRVGRSRFERPFCQLNRLKRKPFVRWSISSRDGIESRHRDWGSGQRGKRREGKTRRREILRLKRVFGNGLLLLLTWIDGQRRQLICYCCFFRGGPAATAHVSLLMLILR